MAGSTILVVDGDQASRNYIAAALEKEGHRVLHASSAKEGLIVAWRDRPDLIVADPVLTDLPGEQFAARLRSDPRTAKVPLVAISRDGSPGRILSCKDAGFNQYVVKGPQAMAALVDAVAVLLGGQASATRQGGLLIAFLSAKGGAGTSSLCANLARVIADRNPEPHVAVADLVLPIGSIAGIVGYKDDLNLVTVADKPAADTTPKFLASQLPRVEEWHFSLLPGSPDPQQANDLAAGRIGGLVAGLQSAYDFVLLDLGRSLSRISLPLIEHADLVVMVFGADMSTVALTRTTWDYLKSRGVQPSAMYPILNRAVGLEGLTKAEIEQNLGIPVKVSVPYLAGNLSMANNQHQPFSVKFPRDTATIVLKDAAQQMIDQAKRQRAS